MLKGKVALITGGSRGIGSEIATELGKEGAYVVINYNGNEAAAMKVLENIKQQGGHGEIYQCNIGNFEEVKGMIDTIVTNHKRIDIIVNNAGITKDNLLIKMSEQDFDDVVTINLKGAFNTIKNAARYMIKQRSGKIINISSISGVTGNAGQANYCASKAGLIGMTKSVARELASRNITVNAVAPGFIETDMTSVLSEKQVETIKETIPLKRLGKVNDIAYTVAFLASDKADYITGQVVEVNGGMNM